VQSGSTELGGALGALGACKEALGAALCVLGLSLDASGLALVEAPGVELELNSEDGKGVVVKVIRAKID
jgi:hypothetical protein